MGNHQNVLASQWPAALRLLCPGERKDSWSRTMEALQGDLHCFT